MDPWNIIKMVSTRFTPKGFDKSEIEMALETLLITSHFAARWCRFLLNNFFGHARGYHPLWRLWFGILTKVMQHQRLTLFKYHDNNVQFD